MLGFGDFAVCIQGLSLARAPPKNVYVQALAQVWPGLGPMDQADRSLRPDDGRIHFRVVLEKSIFCYINRHHKHYILVDTYLTTFFVVGFQENIRYCVLSISSNISIYIYIYICIQAHSSPKCHFQKCRLSKNIEILKYA